MPSPAENAATVREALDFSKGVTGPEQIQEALVALAALLAQAEAGDRFSERAFDQQKARAEAAEADRDAAVRERDQAREALALARSIIVSGESLSAKAEAQIDAVLTGEGTDG